MNHWFCRGCGIYTFHDAISRLGHQRVNLACLDDLGPLSLAIDVVDGRSF